MRCQTFRESRRQEIVSENKITSRTIFGNTYAVTWCAGEKTAGDTKWSEIIFTAKKEFLPVTWVAFTLAYHTFGPVHNKFSLFYLDSKLHYSKIDERHLWSYMSQRHGQSETIYNPSKCWLELRSCAFILRSYTFIFLSVYLSNVTSHASTQTNRTKVPKLFIHNVIKENY